MAIWEFTAYSKEDLKKIIDCINILSMYGIEQDEDMVMEIQQEFRKRLEEDEE